MKSACALFFLVLMLSLVAGCSKRVMIVNRGHLIAQQVPTLGAIHPYPGLPIEHEDGPLLAVFLSSNEDIDRLSRKLTHHLYFELLPCSQTAHGPSLFEGTVFMATQDERQKWLASSELTSKNLYKVYVPLDGHRIMKSLVDYRTLDVPRYLETSRQDGLCLRLGGGQMYGASLFSNLVSAPLSLQGTSLIVIDGPQPKK